MRGMGALFYRHMAEGVAASSAHARKGLWEGAALFSRAGRKKDGKADPAEIAKINVFAVFLKLPTSSAREKSSFPPSYSEVRGSV